METGYPEGVATLVAIADGAGQPLFQRRRRHHRPRRAPRTAASRGRPARHRASLRPPGAAHQDRTPCRPRSDPLLPAHQRQHAHHRSQRRRAGRRPPPPPSRRSFMPAGHRLLTGNPASSRKASRTSGKGPVTGQAPPEISSARRADQEGLRKVFPAREPPHPDMGVEHDHRQLPIPPRHAVEEIALDFSLAGETRMGAACRGGLFDGGDHHLYPVIRQLSRAARARGSDHPAAECGVRRPCRYFVIVGQSRRPRNTGAGSGGRRAAQPRSASSRRVVPITLSSESVLAIPFPAMSRAVPWSTEVRR